VDQLGPFIKWAKAHGKRAFLGEFGAPADATCLSALDALLALLDANREVFLGWTYWAAGPWWGDADLLSVQPYADGRDKPQFAVLAKHLGQHR
jgi:endoglucanase